MAPGSSKQEHSLAGPSSERPNKKFRSHPYPSKPSRTPHEDALPGVQRLKSALRQTKRLLAKDNLAADVRAETQRRLKALEADLARSEQSRKERQYASKYHKVKFFERQKVIRKISQTKRNMATSEGEVGLESTLADLRVDLNYILHFPKTKKYLSLFHTSGSIPAPVASSSLGDEERSKLREMIRQQMECGELSAEPENELGKLGDGNKRTVPRRRAADIAHGSIKARICTDTVASDDFFGDDDQEDSQQSETSYA